jgi:dTDP-glucose 4,6-dehydratase/UDP-glucose 4-epimerase
MLLKIKLPKMFAAILPKFTKIDKLGPFSMKLLILGASGFIGSNLVKFFNTHTSYVIYTAGTTPSAFNNTHFIFPEDRAEFDNILQQTQPDIIINASGSPSVNFSLLHPSEDYRLNTYNTYLLLESIRKYSVNTQFIHLSSAAVYGNPIQLPISETARLQPLSPYGFHKLQAEKICEFFTHYYGLKTINLRIFSAFGPGLQKQLFGDILKKIQNGTNTIELSGTGNESRDFIFIDDVCKAMNCVINHCPFDGSAINIGTGTETSIKEAVDKLAKAMPISTQFIFNGKAQNENPLNWRADISLLKKTGFIPEISFDTGIQRVAHYKFQKHN